MEMSKRTHIKNMRYEDFKDNEYLEQYVEELRKGGAPVVVTRLSDMINWGRSHSVWPLTFATSCCGIEFMCVGGAHTDFARFGWEVYRNSPRQADVIFVFGTIVHKMAPVLKRLYDQMAEPKYVVAVGSCAICGGPFRNSYHVVKGVDEVIPVDVYVPGMPSATGRHPVRDDAARTQNQGTELFQTAAAACGEGTCHTRRERSRV